MSGSSSSNQIVHTICLQTRDAILREEDRFVFRLPGDVPRMKAVKIALGSLEFPMVQWTVEESRGSRFHLNEGHRIQREWSILDLRVKTPSKQASEAWASVSVHLPLHLNQIKSWKHGSDNRWTITCTHPHGLWTGDGTCMLGCIATWGNVCIHASPFGNVVIDAEQSEPLLVSPTAFSIKLSGNHELPTSDEAGGSVGAAPSETSVTAPLAGYLCTPSPPSSKALTQLLTQSCRGAHSELSLLFSYVAAHNTVVVKAISHLESHVLEVLPTRLSCLLGMGTLVREVSIPARKGVVLQTEQLDWWTSVALTPGWYGPSHRPMCTGSPLHMGAELEFALNRFYLPIPERISEGDMTSHFFVFADPCGTTYSISIPCGFHAPDRLCLYIEESMTLLARRTTPGVTFRMTYDDERFTIECSINVSDGESHSAPFTLLFSHPLQMDPRRLGFDALQYAGRSAYRSAHVCSCPNIYPPLPSTRLGDGDNDAELVRHHVSHSNIYRVSEISNQKRFRVHGSPQPHVTGIIQNYLISESILVLRTHVGVLPFCHGLNASDIVHLCPTQLSKVLAPNDDARWVETDVIPCPLSNSYARGCVVLPPSVDPVNSVDRYCTLRLRVKPTRELKDCIGQSVHIQRTPAPFNLCSGILPRSLPEDLLGLRRGALQYGIDGSIGPHGAPPYEAPRVHNLDHPDYVLMYLDEGKRGTLLQHSNGESTTTPLAKIVFYPNLREERMLPRDTTMLSGESLTTFSVRFANADGTPYCFHGADFSLSLNLIKADI